MINTKELQRPVSLAISPYLEDHLELSRLLAAAIVNPPFCRLLLDDPIQAIENGYQGETFLLAEAEYYLILSIHAGSLTELTQRIARALGMELYTPLSSFSQTPDFLGF